MILPCARSCLIRPDPSAQVKWMGSNTIFAHMRKKADCSHPARSWRSAVIIPVWDYFTVDDGNIDLSRYDYLVIGTIESFVKLRDYFSQDAVLPIYIEVEDGVRLQRALDRERCQKYPKYEEMCRRFLADAADFSKEKLQEAGIHRIFYNEDLECTEEDIVCFMREVMMSEEG